MNKVMKQREFCRKWRRLKKLEAKKEFRRRHREGKPSPLPEGRTGASSFDKSPCPTMDPAKKSCLNVNEEPSFLAEGGGFGEIWEKDLTTYSF